MIIGGIEAQPHQLSYDKILKYTLSQSNPLTIQFINGVFNDNISQDALVEWLEKESTSDKHTAIVADSYPRVDGKMYAIEIEQDGKGDMAVRVFRYAIGGAMLHSMTATKSELHITIPQPCVVFLKSTINTPSELTWNIDFFDDQKVTLKVPAIRLADLSVEEIARRNLLPIGQFYLRTFEPLTKRKVDAFQTAAASLFKAVKDAVEQEIVPYHIGLQMRDTILEIMENITIKYKEEVDFTMTTDIVETLSWIDYKELFQKIEERAKAEGKAEGEAKGKAEGEKIGKLLMGKELGLTDEQIAVAAELPLEEVKAFFCQ